MNALVDEEEISIISLWVTGSKLRSKIIKYKHTQRIQKSEWLSSCKEQNTYIAYEYGSVLSV